MSYDDWMPYDEERPQSEGEYLTTWVAEVGTHGKTFTGMEILEYDGGWETHDIEKRGFRNVRITAWMPLPEKYREEYFDDDDGRESGLLAEY